MVITLTSYKIIHLKQLIKAHLKNIKLLLVLVSPFFLIYNFYGVGAAVVGFLVGLVVGALVVGLAVVGLLVVGLRVGFIVG